MAWELRDEINPSVPKLFFGQCFLSASEEQTRTEIGTEEWDIAVMDLTVAFGGKNCGRSFMSCYKRLEEVSCASQGK